MDYARQDTHYLIALRDILRDELRQRELLDLANEDFRRMATANASSENREPGDGDYTAGCWRVRGSHDLHPQQAAVLRELCSYRERAARAMNRPLFKVIHDQTLLQIAALTPRSPEELLQTPGMSPKQMQRHGSHLLQAVQRGLKAAPIHPPRHMRLDAKLAERLEALRAWRKNTGLVLHMPSDVVLPRDLLFHVAEKDPQGPEELREAMAEVPWRFEHFGAAILQILAMVKTK
jgi:ribonuclease D